MAEQYPHTPMTMNEYLVLLLLRNASLPGHELWGMQILDLLNATIIDCGGKQIPAGTIYSLLGAMETKHHTIRRAGTLPSDVGGCARVCYVLTEKGRQCIQYMDRLLAEVEEL